MSAFLLKLIALIAMIVDHTGVVFQPLFDVPLYSLCRAVGRVAFPLFLFFIAEGCRRTRSIKLYLLRLGAFALISEIPFDLASADLIYIPVRLFDFGAYDLMNSQNVFFTFFLGALCVYLYQTFNTGFKRFIYVVFIPLIVYLGDRFHTDYGSAGVLFVFILYILPYGAQAPGKPLQMSAAGKFYRLAAMFCLIFYLYIFKWNYDSMKQIMRAGGFWMLLEMLPQVLPADHVRYMLFSCISLFMLAFYNNRRGKPQRWLFYAAYPVHLLILGIIRYLYVLPVLLSY